MDRVWLITASVWGFLAVVFGAFGAHALKKRLSVEDLAIFETGVRYQMYHALALLAVAVLAHAEPSRAQVAGWAFNVGILIFSGSLYALVLSGVRVLGAVTPLGGLAFLVGWGALIYGAISRAGN